MMCGTSLPGRARRRSGFPSWRRARPAVRSACLGDVLHALLGRRAELLGLLAASFLGGLLGLLGHLLHDLLAALDRLAPGVRGLLLHRVRDGPELLVLLA